MTHIRRWFFPPILTALAAMSVALAMALVGCGGDEPSPTAAATAPGVQTQTVTPVPPATPTSEPEERTLTVYSGRSQTLVHPLLELFGEQAGVAIRVKYAGSASTVATLLEEGDNSPADVVYPTGPRFPGHPGRRRCAGPDSTGDPVEGRSEVSLARRGVGGHVRPRQDRHIQHRSNRPSRDLPSSILDFTAPEWNGRVGWAPGNGSFQAFVTALRLLLGEDAAREWLEGMKANDAQEYPNNVTTVAATANGEVDVGFVQSLLSGALSGRTRSRVRGTQPLHRKR